MSVRCRNECAVLQVLDAWVAAIPFVVIVLETHQVLADAALDQIIVGSDPRNPIAFELVIAVAGVSLPERNQEPSIIAVFARMAIAIERTGEITWLRPGFSFVVGENDLRVMTPAVFA